MAHGLTLNQYQPSEGGGVGSIPTRTTIMENKIYKLTDQEFSDLVKSSLNTSEVLFKLGYTTKGNSWGYSQVKQRMKDFRGKSPMLLNVEQKKISEEDLLCVDSRHPRNVLRKYIINNKLIPYKCNICGINGKEKIFPQNQTILTE